MNTQRILNLVDGVFAIVMTILIFDFKVPQLPAAKVDTQLFSKLLELWPRLIAYVLSFIVLGVYWVIHHTQFRFIIKVDRNILWINIFFLMAVAFVPFSAALLGSYANQQESIVLYGINLIVIGTILFLNWTYATHNYRLVKNDIGSGFIRKLQMKIIWANAFYLLAIIICFYSPAISIAIYVLVPLYYIRPGRFDQKNMQKE